MCVSFTEQRNEIISCLYLKTSSSLHISVQRAGVVAGRCLGSEHADQLHLKAMRPFVFQDIDAQFFLSSPHPLQCLWIQTGFSAKSCVRDSLCMCHCLYCAPKIIKTLPKGMAQGTDFLFITFTCLPGSSDCPWRKNKPL